MKLFIFSILFLGVLMLATVPAAHAQGGGALDTVNLRYGFKQGQTLSYRVIAVDSIILYDKAWRTLARERVEVVTYYCDSVLRDGYIMTVVTEQYAATEWVDSLPPVTRTDHPWVQRPITFLMSPTGRRVDLVAGDTVPGNAPGGPFAPLLLPHLGGVATYIGASGSFDNEQWTLDNMFPPVKWQGLVFKVLPRRLDTLDRKNVVQVDLTEVANVVHKLPGDSLNPVTRTTVNGGGSYYFDTKAGYPVGGSYNEIARFTMEFPGGKEVDGRHIIGMIYELLESPKNE